MEQDKRRLTSKEYIVALHDRIEALELQIRRLSPGGTDLPGTVSTGSPSIFSKPGSVTSCSGGSSGPSTSTLPSYVSEDLADDNDEESPQSGTNDEDKDITYILQDHTGRLNRGEDGQPRFFGIRSNLYMLKTPMTIKSNDVVDLRYKSAHVVNVLKKGYELTRVQRDELLDNFWRWQNSIIPIVWKRLFLDDLNNDEEPIKKKYATPFLLSAMLAVGARSSSNPYYRSNPEDPNSAGFKYANHAKILLMFEREIPTIPMVQTACLLSMHCLSMDSEAHSWYYCGLALRSAYTLGLNLDISEVASDDLIDDNDVQLRRMVWWACYLLESNLCSMLGRSTSIKKELMTISPPSELTIDEFEKWTSQEECPKELEGTFTRQFSTFTYTIESLITSANVLDTLYSPINGLSVAEQSILAGKLHLDLVEFRDNAPSYLKLKRTIKEPVLPNIYMFHIRLNLLFISTHKPFLRMSSSTKSVVIDSHSISCFLSAKQSTSIIRSYKYHYGLRRIDIFAPDAILTVAIIHLLFSNCNRDKIRKLATYYLNICVVCLKEMAESNYWAKRCLYVLNQMAEENGFQSFIKQPTDENDFNYKRAYTGVLLEEESDFDVESWLSNAELEDWFNNFNQANDIEDSTWDIDCLGLE
ncbi:hypothetical protein G9P44_005597 [Scheffersomyces stipitis]|nr:hypothetical protein G9P44_005597 [Scheffersomyces stipitis]